MAKYDVLHSCGHQETIKLFGKIEGRYRVIADLKNNGLCSKCRDIQKAKLQQEEFEKASSQSQGLPSLTGTEKQVKWGTVIRAEFFNKVLQQQEKHKSLVPPKNKDNYEKTIKAYNSFFDDKTSSKWWIDNHDNLYKYEFSSLFLDVYVKALRPIFEGEITVDNFIDGIIPYLSSLEGKAA